MAWRLGLLALLPLTMQAAPLPHGVRQDVLATAERCALISAREVFDLSTLPTSELQANAKQIEMLLQSAQDQRRDCFISLQQQLNAASRTTVSATTLPAQLVQDWQATLDASLVEWLRLRAGFSTAQLASLEQDLAVTLSASDTVAGLMESPSTRALLDGELRLALELERRQLTLDSFTAQTPLQQTEVALAWVHHHLAQAQTVLEHPTQQSVAVTLYQLHSHLAPASSQLDVALGYLPATQPELQRQLTNLRARLRQSSSIIQQAADDARAGLFAADPQTFMTQQYDALSRLSGDVRAVLAAIGRKLQE